MTDAQAARMIELLEQIARQTAGLNPRAGYDAGLANLILGGPEELVRQNRERRAARARNQRRQP